MFKVKCYLSFTVFLFSLHTQAESLRFTLKPDGTFRLQMDIDFPPKTAPVAILERYTDPETVLGSSDIIKKLEYEKNSWIRDLRARGTPEVVMTKSCKIICAETKSLCAFSTITSSQAEYSCKVDTTHDSTEDLFHFGSTQYSCKKSDLSTRCSFVLEGQPKPQGILMFKRTSRQLALGGAVETVSSHLKIALPMAQDRALIDRTLQWAETDFYKTGTELLESDKDKVINITHM